MLIRSFDIFNKSDKITKDVMSNLLNQNKITKLIRHAKLKWIDYAVQCLPNYTKLN